MKALEALPGHAPDLVDPVVGYRQWRLVEGTLRSPYRGAPWARTEAEASCDTGRHDPQDTPAKGCTCGIYAYYDPCPRTASAGTRDLVGGAVVLWGRIELHTTGMRAQRGAIAVLERPILPGRKRRELTGLATRLGVPIVPHRELRAAAATRGLPLAPSLRPPRSWASRESPSPPGILPSAVAKLLGALRPRQGLTPGATRARPGLGNEAPRRQRQ